MVDVETAVAEVRRRGAEAVVLLGNSGGGSLMALAQATAAGEGEPLGDAFVALAAHPGEGVFMLQVIDPSVTDEADPFSVDPALDMYDPANGWRPWPEPSSLRPGVAGALPRRPARPGGPHRRGRPRRARRPGRGRRPGARPLERGSAEWNRAAPPGRARPLPHDLPDPRRPRLPRPVDRPRRPRRSASVFAFPDPLDANYGYGGLARVMTARGWLSTWSGLSSHAALADTMPAVTVPTLVVHPTGDTEIRLHQAAGHPRRLRRRRRAPTSRSQGAPHYLHGHRREAMATVVDWLRSRVPT